MCFSADLASLKENNIQLQIYSVLQEGSKVRKERDGI